MKNQMTPVKRTVPIHIKKLPRHKGFYDWDIQIFIVCIDKNILRL